MVVVITAVIAAVIYFGFATPASALSRAGGVCDRTAEVRDAVVAATGAGACGSVTALQLRDVVSLDLSNKSIASLNSGDFDGLYALDVLDMSDNSLMSLPAGVFDDLLLLRTLRLHGNSLPTLPAGIFDQLFLLEEITLNDNQFTSLPEGLFEELSRFDGFAANGDAPDNSASYPRIQRFIDRHSITSPEEFIAALPDAYKQRFVMMYSSEAPAAPHVSGDYPRVISFGGDGALTFAWNTDPSAPAMFRQSVEFLRQNDTDWTAGVIDFSGESPQIVEPASCQSCHSPLNKPMWGMWGEWSGSETATRGIFSEAVVQAAVAAMDRALASSDPRIEPLDFSASSFAGGTRFFAPPGRVPSVAAVEEAGAVWAWRHAEVLYGILRGRHTDFRSFSDGVVCTAHDQQASFALTLQSFSQPEQNLFVSDADEEFPDEPGYQPPYSNDLVSYTYYFHTDGSLGDAVLLLLIADVWREEPIVRRLYRSVSNSGTVLPYVTGSRASAMLHYPAGSATAEDELIQKLRLHFGQGTAASLDARAEQNGRQYLGGVLSASFRDGHLSAIWPRICNVLTGSVPGSLSVALDDADAVLSWKAPTHDADAVTGYRIWRGTGTADPVVYVADTGSTETTWTDEDPAVGDYAYAVQALYDDYYPGRESAPVEVSVSNAPHAVGNLRATARTNQVTLSWAAPSSGPSPTGYRILRGATSTTLEVLVSDTSSTATSYVDSTAATDEAYSYSVGALNGIAAGPAADPVRIGPEVSSASAFSVVEGDTVVGALSATDADTDVVDLVWSIPTGVAGGADASEFSLSASGVLAFVAAKDFEGPDDADGNGVYEVTVRVSDGVRSATGDVEVSLANRNEAPTADAGADQAGVAMGATVTLAGSGTDPDAGDALAYVWTQAGGENVALSGASTATASFDAPSGLTEDATLVFTLTVTDAGALTHRDQVTVTVTAPVAPVVSSASAFSVVEGDTVVGALSATDADTDVVDLVWSIPTGVAGGADASEFSLSASGVLAFVAAKDFEGPDDADGNGVYEVTVRVSDGVRSATGDVEVSLANRNEAPTADAGADQAGVAMGATVTLAGSGTDPDAGDALAYVWTQAGGENVALSGASTATASFDAPSGLTEDATLVFTLTVTDAGALTHRDQVTVTVTAPVAPVVSSASAFSVVEGDTVVGALSATDADTDVVDLVWSIPTGVAGGADASEFSLSASGVLAFVAAKDFEGPDDADGNGVYEVTVRVSDGVRSATGDVEVSLANRNEAPTADAGADQAGVAMGATVTLAGSGTDPDAGDALAYVWTQAGGENVALSGASTATASFDAPSGLTEDATLVFTLTVTDAGALTHRDQVTVTVEGPPPAVELGELLTAAAESLPQSHDGSTSFTFEVVFSEEVSLGFRAVRDSVFEVTGGEVTYVRRHSPPSNMRWVITVEPSSDEEVVLVLPSGRPCGSNGAVCTSDDRMLSNRLDLTVEGPAPAAAPVVSSASAFSVVEGDTVVGALSATDADTDVVDLVWSIPTGVAGGADASEFSLSASGVLAFVAAKDFEGPDDADGNGVYEVTVRVSDAVRSATGDVEVSLANRNEAPTADAGADQAGVAMGATVTLAGSGTDPDAGDALAYAWTQAGGENVALSGASTATASFDAPSGLTEDATLVFTLTVTDAGALTHRDQVTVTVEGPPPAVELGELLTAAAESLPQSHDGSTSFTFEVVFSEEVSLGFRAVRDSVFEVTGGEVTYVRRHSPPSNMRWVITVEPSSDEEVVLVLPSGRPCGSNGAVCTSDDRMLSNRLDLTVEGPAPAAAPVVSSASAFSVVEGDTVVGALSATDADTDVVDLVWSVAGGADASEFSLSASGVLAFVAAKDFEGPDDADGNGVYEVTVRVSDAVRSATGDVEVSLANRNEAPTADAGADQAGVAMGATVTLAGSGTDPDAGDALAYAWTQAGGENVALSGASTATASFDAPSGLTEDATLVFTLTVTDAGALTHRDQVTVTVTAPVAPVVSSASAFSVVEGDTVVGALSATDADTDVVDLVWSVAGGADASEFSLSASGVLAFVAAKDFEGPDDADGNGVYEVTVRVSDAVRSATGDVEVSLANRNEAPTADAGADQAGVAMGATVTLAGSGTDPDAGDALAYAWTQAGGENVALSGASTATASFDAPSGLTEDATLVFTLTVTDAGALTHRDQVTVTVATAGPARAVEWGERLMDRDIVLGGSPTPSGLWSNDTHMWIITDWQRAKVSVYSLADGSLQSDDGLVLSGGNGYLSALWSDNTTLWAADFYGGVRAYRLSDGVRVPSEDFDSAVMAAASNLSPSGLWSNGNIIWVADYSAMKAFAYLLSDKTRVPARDIDLVGGGGAPINAFGIWSNGHTLLTASWLRREITAQALSDGQRQPDRDLDTSAIQTHNIAGIWSNGEILWVVFDNVTRVYAFAVPGLD